MRFKIDENLPREVAEILTGARHDATTIIDEQLRGENDPRIIDVCLHEHRALITLDLDFADVRAYPPELFFGIIVLRVHRQDKKHLITLFNRLIPILEEEAVQNRLWIVEESRIRIRGGEA